MEDKNNNSFSDLLSIMYDATYDTSNYVFVAYLKSDKRIKPIYNLFAESFISVKSFCLLMMNKAWAQAAIILRTLIEQVATLFVLSFYPSTIIAEYTKFDSLRRQYYSLNNKTEEKAFIKQKKLQFNSTITDYLSYGWIQSLTKTNSYGRNQLLTIAKLEEFLPDIHDILNHFVHGQLSIFDFNSKEHGWTLMSQYGHRMCLMCAKSFDFLVCSYAKWADQKLVELTTRGLFSSFKMQYQNVNKINKTKHT